jgi:hypothetical protein
MRIGKPPKVDKKLLPMIKLSTVVETLEKWLRYQNTAERVRIALAYEELVGEHQIEGVSQETEDTLLNLCTDCAYYSENPEHLSEDPALLNYDKFKAIILEVLEKIGNS